MELESVEALAHLRALESW